MPLAAADDANTFDIPGSVDSPPQWVWEAMEPADRRENLERLRNWITWMTNRHCEPPVDLRDRIPGCWFLHPGPLDRLTGLYLEWLRVYTAAGDLPIPSFFDALDRHTSMLGFAGKCLKRRHDELQAADPLPDWDTWLAESEFTTAPAITLDFATQMPSREAPMDMSWFGPAPEDHKPTILSAREMKELIEAGDANQLGGTPAVFYDDDWWFGDEETYVRVDDPQVRSDMNKQALKLEAAEKAALDIRAIPGEETES
ncbi:hypothetical protein [Actinoallomurus acanthiterrae]